MKKITLIGAGMMGTALTVPLSDNGHSVRVVGTPLDREIIDFARQTHTQKNMNRQLPEKNEYYYFEEAAQALEGADIVIDGVSSFGVDWFIEKALPLIPADVPVICVTKGLVCEDDGTLITFPDYIKARDPLYHSINAIGGPCTSYELADRRHSAVTFCGDDMGILRMLKQTFETGYYHISLSTDVTGVECAVAMKNAYALAVTMAVGMLQREEGEDATLAYNPQAAIFGQSVREMRRMLRLLGGNDDNIVYAAGDLYVTVFGGRTRLLGTLLGKGLSFREAQEKLAGVTLESVSIARRTVRAIRLLSARGLAREEDYPVLMYIGSLLEGKEDAGMPWEKFEAEEWR